MSGLKAIPTTYNGRVYRSRLESNVALMLDQLGIVFEHEPSSFLLDDGTHYMPDFWCPTIRLWIEARGYSTPKADRQIELFGKAIMSGRLDEFKMLHKQRLSKKEECTECAELPEGGLCSTCYGWRGSTDVDYMVLSPNRACRFFEVPSWHSCEGQDDGVIVCLCQCGQAYFASASNDWRCRSCGASDKRYHTTDWQEFYLDELGAPTVESHKYNRQSQGWDFLRQSISEWIKRARAPKFTPAKAHPVVTVVGENVRAHWETED